MKLLVCLSAFWVFLNTSAFFSSATPPAALTDEVNAFMKAHVTNGRVDYARLKKSDDDLDALYKQLGSVNLNNASAGEKKAFYINAYNVAVIHEVVQAFPLKSPQDKAGFFDKTKHRIAGQAMTLNQLEKEKLLKPYSDARVHFAVVCAAVSCPSLADFAYTAEKLDAQLDDRAKLSLNSPDFIRVDKGEKKVAISKIFDWYKDDFTKGGKSVLAYINGYRRDPIPADFKVSYYEYDWSLNGR